VGGRLGERKGRKRKFSCEKEDQEPEKKRRPREKAYFLDVGEGDHLEKAGAAHDKKDGHALKSLRAGKADSRWGRMTILSERR